tara:strand:- start:1015 stop:1317 length:303 start_codon:yes stop_codon:yes gene_type:complete
MKTIADIAKSANLEEKTLRKYITGFVPFYFDVFDIGEGIYSTFYTDGDGGLMLFEGYCETFEEQGVSVRLIDCNYCDISYSQMATIMQQLEEANNLEDLE